MHKLTRKSEEGYLWNKECQNAFMSLHALHLYCQFYHPFIVATDASGTAIGAVLSQDVEGEEKCYCFLGSATQKS